MGCKSRLKFEVCLPPACVSLFWRLPKKDAYLNIGNYDNWRNLILQPTSPLSISLPMPICFWYTHLLLQQTDGMIIGSSAWNRT